MQGNTVIHNTVNAYDSLIIRAYSRIRFSILHQRFLDEIGQYLPETGRVLDVGCGFGLFALYFAQMKPGLEIYGIDINQNRVEKAAKAAQHLGVANAHFSMGDANLLDVQDRYHCVYMLDIIHHMSSERVPSLITQLYDHLESPSRLIIKDIETIPLPKLWFTWLLDKLMDMQARVTYWERAVLLRMLTERGFEVFSHSMVDILPYPHIIYICNK
jgi:2-polyprenyl-3-methyl-5-hydroxy-6-metoxy-1,4-benzoquinol methylase